jgi:hypothetical protein
MNDSNFLEKIHYSALFIDHGYQRQIVKQRITDMANNFDTKAMAALVVSKRENGNYAIIDGQHRYLSGIKAGIEYFPCQIFIGLNYEDEAKLFHTINVNRGPMKSAQQFKALIESKDFESIEILKIVEKHGFKIKFTGPAEAKNEIKAIKELKEAYRVAPEHLDLVMRIMREVWNGDKRSCTHHIIGALSRYIQLYGDQIDLKRLTKVLSGVLIEEIILKAKARVQIDNIYLTNAVEKEIFKLYNKTLKKKIS